MRKHSKFVREQFEKDAETYDSEINDILPYYEEMHAAILELFDFDEDKELLVLDLGIGTGKTALEILKKFKNAEVDAIDLSPRMIAVAKKRLNEFKNKINFIEGDMIDFKPEKKYNACVGVISIHHLNQDEKKHFFKKMFSCLEAGGIFIIGDIIIGDTLKETRKIEEEWKDYLIQKAGSKGAEWFNAYKKEDFPDSINNQLNWLKDAGFKAAGFKWKKMNCAVIFGRK